MNEQKTIFDYMEQVLCTFAVSVLILILLAFLFGEDTKEISTMFQLGSKGIPSMIILQFLAVSIFITIIRHMFYSERFFPNMSGNLRMMSMIIGIIIVIAIFAGVFAWFPINDWRGWSGFAISFLLCFLVSTGIMIIRTKLENKKMQDALEQVRKQWEEQNAEK